MGGAIYDLLMAVLGALGLSRARQRLGAHAVGRVLEVGAGTGLMARHYAPGGEPRVAIDIDLAGLQRARRRDVSALQVCADVQALPFRAGSFDTVVASLVFCSVPAPAVGLAEVRRVLAPQGRLRMLEHVRPPGRFLGRLADRLTPAWSSISGGCHLDRDTERLVRDAGFALTEVRRPLGGAAVELSAQADHRDG